MAEVTRAEATAQARRTIGAYRDRVHEARNDTEYLPPEGARIVNDYCSFENDWQELVQDAIRETSFLDGMDDGLLLEYCAVCMELDEVLKLGSWRIGRVDRIIGVADLSYFEKIRRAIEYSDILNEIMEEVGNINALVTQMVVVSGGLIALSFTGIGAAAEFALLLVGSAFAGTEFLKGIAGLVKFFTTVDDAKTEEDLKSCGKLFGDAVAKIGVNGLFFIMSMFGLKKASARLTAKTIADSNPNSGKWTWKSFKENLLKIGENRRRIQLIEELKQNGIKCNEKEIIKILKMDDGKIIFLETGNERAGFMHILKHENDFFNKGIGRDVIPELIFHALREGKVVGSQGRGRLIYECEFNGVTQRVAITISENGFVVGANPSK